MRLTGHATKPEDMIRSRWNDWLVSVEDGYNLLRTCSEKIILIGLSMGAALSLIFASSHPVDGVVAMSTPYSLPNDPRLKFIKLISLFIKYLPKSKGDPGANWFDQDSWKKHIAYPQNPVRSIAELNQLLHVMQKSLQNVEVPVLLIHSRDDDYIIRHSMEKIYSSLGTSNKEKLWVEGGGHVITEEPTRHEIFKASADFIGRVTGL